MKKNIQGTGEFEEIRKYDFCLTRLALSYIGSIMCLYLNSFLKFVDRQISEGKIASIKDKDTFVDSIEQYSKNTSYFWFIYNEPDYYYRQKYASKLITRKNSEDEKKGIEDKKGMEELKKRISEMTASEIEYYKNPLETLEELSAFYGLNKN